MLVELLRKVHGTLWESRGQLPGGAVGAAGGRADVEGAFAAAGICFGMAAPGTAALASAGGRPAAFAALGVMICPGIERLNKSREAEP